MESKVDEYLNLPYCAVVVPDETTDEKPCYVAYNPELEGCLIQGETPEEALSSLVEVRKLYISTLLAEGLEVPLPHRGRVSWTVIEPPGQEPEVACNSLTVSSPTFVFVS